MADPEDNELCFVVHASGAWEGAARQALADAAASRATGTTSR